MSHVQQDEIVQHRKAVEARLLDGQRKVVACYLQENPSLLADANAVLDLVYAEVAFLEQQGETPNWQELFADISQHSGSIDKLRAVHTEFQDTVSDAVRGLEHGASYATPLPSVPSPPNLRIEQEIGRGGMGVVYRATQLNLGRTVAYKTLAHPVDAKHWQRFLQEARLTARLKHPHIAQVYEVGEHDGTPFILMEYVDGQQLQQCLADRALQPHDVLKLTIQVCAACHHAHQSNLLHRDLKPSNILIARDAQVKVVDFGLAKNITQEDEPCTHTGVILGTPSYMAPERFSEAALGPECDIFSIGAILYEALGGRAPFHGGSLLQIVDNVRNMEPVPLRQLNPSVSRDLETVCHKCLEKSPERRYRSTLSLSAELERILCNRPVEARPASWHEKTWRCVVRNPIPSSLVVSTCLAIICGFWGVLWQWQKAVHQSRIATQQTQQAERNLYNFQALTMALLKDTDDLQERDNAADRLRLLEQVFAKFSELPDSDTELKTLEIRRLLALRIAHMYQDRGEFEAAFRHFHVGLEIEGTLAQWVDQDRQDVAMAGTYFAFASCHLDAGNTSEATDHFRQSFQLANKVRERSPDHYEARSLACSAFINWTCRLELNRRNQLENEKLPAILNRCTDAFLAHPEISQASHLRSGLEQLGQLLALEPSTEWTDRADTQNALRVDERALSPKLANDLLNFSLGVESLGLLRARQQCAVQARTYLRRTAELQTRLAKQFPDHFQFQYHLGRTLSELVELGLREETLRTNADTKLLEVGNDAEHSIATSTRLFQKFPARQESLEQLVASSVHYDRWVVHSGSKDVTNEPVPVRHWQVLANHLRQRQELLPSALQLLEHRLTPHAVWLEENAHLTAEPPVRLCLLRVAEIGAGPVPSPEQLGKILDARHKLAQAYLTQQARHLGEETLLECLNDLALLPPSDASRKREAKLRIEFALSNLSVDALEIAIRSGEQWLEYQPSSWIGNSVAWLYVMREDSQPEDFEKALKLSRAAIARSPTATRLHTYATLCGIAGDPQSGFPALEQYRKYGTTHSSFDVLTEAFLAQSAGQLEHAQSLLKLALEKSNSLPQNDLRQFQRLVNHFHQR